MFWVLEQGVRPRQQLPLSIYTVTVIPAPRLHLPWSDLDSVVVVVVVPPSLFVLAPLATFM